ncbi:hypothetical protein [Ruegeria sp. HKCCA4707]|uniref:hypothetical protein n=1 Tax=Ruegeria sp. HKCCA4707 TaxID=2682984 RepID=UPI001487CF80|nr:hypothetical protein [Ruegeria sp. HKCCA4707]
MIDQIQNAVGAIWDAFLALNADSKINVILVVITLIIAFANVRLVRNAQASHKRELRAYVNVIGGVVEVLPTSIPGTFQAQARIDLVNQGKTPAYKFRTFPAINCGPAESPLFNSNPPPPEDQNSSIIGGSADVSASMLSCELSATELQGLWSGETKIFLTLKTEYEDVFGKKRYFFARATNAVSPSQTYGSPVGTTVGPMSNSTWSITPHKLGYEAN